MELNGYLQDGSILQNEEDTSSNVILILSFIQSPKCSYLYTECSLYVQKIYIQSTIHQSLQFSGRFYSDHMTGKIWMLRGNVYLVCRPLLGKQRRKGGPGGGDDD